MITAVALAIRTSLAVGLAVVITSCSVQPRKDTASELELPKARQAFLASAAVSGSIPMPQIETANKIAKIDVRERVHGFACAGNGGTNDFPRDLYLLKDQKFDLSTPEGQARAAASFDALFGKVLPLTGQATEAAPYYSDDILIAPSYLVQTRRLSSFSTEVCVKVVGYRGVVTGFEDSKIRRDSDGKVTAPNQLVVPDEVQGKFSITVF